MEMSKEHWTFESTPCPHCGGKVSRKWDTVDGVEYDDGAQCESCGEWFGELDNGRCGSAPGARKTMKNCSPGDDEDRLIFCFPHDVPPSLFVSGIPTREAFAAAINSYRRQLQEHVVNPHEYGNCGECKQIRKQIAMMRAELAR